MIDVGAFAFHRFNFSPFGTSGALLTVVISMKL